MRELIRHILEGALFVALVSAPGCRAPTAGKELAGVGNFGEVRHREHPRSFFYRGNQPTERGIATLRAMGVKTVVNLRDDFDPREALWVRDAGMEYLLITTDCRDIRPRQIATFMARMREYREDPSAWPVFVHCHHGRDRTGLYVAVWRIVEEGWDRQAALDELVRYGHSPNNPLICPHVVPYLRQFDPDAFRDRSRDRSHPGVPSAATPAGTLTAPPPANSPAGASG